MTGEVSWDESLIRQADVLIEPPPNGLVWDLARDIDIECLNSSMFQKFASLFLIDEDS